MCGGGGVMIGIGHKVIGVKVGDESGCLQKVNEMLTRC